MPIMMPAYSVHCRDCGWSAVAPAQGDVVTSPQIKRCPDCGSSRLGTRDAGAFGDLGPLTDIAWLWQWWRSRRWK